METPDEAVARNVAELREERKHTVRSLSALLGQLGRPILPSGITKVENGTRRVDAGDLVALAIALGVNPNRLLLPVDGRTEVQLTPTVKAPQAWVWAWARGDQVLPQAAVALSQSDRVWAEAEDDFRRHALPAAERLRDDHTAVRAARDVLRSLRGVLDRAEDPDADAKDAERAKYFRPLVPPPSTPAGLRRALNRLVAEVDALIGDDDGDG